MSQNSLTQSNRSFEHLVELSVREAVTRTLGEPVWKAMGFYFDPKQASNDPEEFASILDKIFGPSSRVLQKVITEILMKKLGGTVTGGFGDKQSQPARSFYDWIQIAKAKFSTSLNSTIGSRLG